MDQKHIPIQRQESYSYFSWLIDDLIMINVIIDTVVVISFQFYEGKIGTY